MSGIMPLVLGLMATLAKYHAAHVIADVVFSDSSRDCIF